MSKSTTPAPDGDAVQETRSWIRDAYEHGKTAIADRPAVTVASLAEYTEHQPHAIRKRLQVDPAVTQVSAVHPETYHSTTAYVLAEDER
jgi:hypothetical protein